MKAKNDASIVRIFPTHPIFNKLDFAQVLKSDNGRRFGAEELRAERSAGFEMTLAERRFGVQSAAPR
jgi:hypothetical protein